MENASVLEMQNTAARPGKLDIRGCDFPTYEKAKITRIFLVDFATS
jgi:hypothetical protein